jgi:hypothetical protein
VCACDHRQHQVLCFPFSFILPPFHPLTPPLLPHSILVFLNMMMIVMVIIKLMMIMMTMMMMMMIVMTVIMMMVTKIMVITMLVNTCALRFPSPSPSPPPSPP